MINVGKGWKMNERKLKMKGTCREKREMNEEGKGRVGEEKV